MERVHSMPHAENGARAISLGDVCHTREDGGFVPIRIGPFAIGQSAIGAPLAICQADRQAF